MHDDLFFRRRCRDRAESRRSVRQNGLENFFWDSSRNPPCAGGFGVESRESAKKRFGRAALAVMLGRTKMRTSRSRGEIMRGRVSSIVSFVHSRQNEAQTSHASMQRSEDIMRPAAKNCDTAPRSSAIGQALRPRRPQSPSFVFSRSFTACGFALPPEAFMT